MNGALGSARTLQAQYLVFTAIQGMVVHEELFKLLLEFPAELVHVPDMRVAVIAVLDGNDAVIAFFAVLATLFALNDAHDAAGQTAAGKRRLVHEYEHIQRITVAAAARWHEAEIVGKRHSGGQHFLEIEDAIFHVVGILVAAALGCFDHHDDRIRVLWDHGRQAGRIGEAGGDFFLGCHRFE